MISPADSFDVMDGIIDDDDEEEMALNFMPRALSPTAGPKNMQQKIKSGEPRSEKGVDRLLLMVKYPNAGEGEIQEVLHRKEMQSNAAKTAASRKGQLFRERRRHEDAERWKEKQEREQQKQQQLQQQQLQQQQQLYHQQQQMQMHSALDLLVSQQDSTVDRNISNRNDDREEKRYPNIADFGIHDNISNGEEYPKGSFDQAPNVSISILSQRSFEAKDDEAECDDEVMWQAATGDNDCINFKNGVDGNYSSGVRSNSNGGSSNDEEQQCKNQEESQKKERTSKNIVAQTRKGIKSVFGGASKIFRTVLPLADADANANVDSANRLDSTCDALSINSTGGDNRSYTSSKISYPTSQASAITYKISNVKLPNFSNKSEFDNHTRDDNYPTQKKLTNDDSNEEGKNKKCCYGDWALRKWVVDRKKNKLLICIFSFIIVMAIIITILGALNGNHRRANINASKELGNQQVGIVNTNEFYPSPSPSSGMIIEVEPPEIFTKYPTENTSGFSSPSKEDIEDENGENLESSTTAESMTTTNPTDMNSPSSAPTTTLLTSSSVVPLPSPSPTTILPTESIPTEDDFSNWLWPEDAEDGNILQGIPRIDQHFGQTISLSDDGLTLVVGSPDALDNAGIVRIYEQIDNSWISTGSLLGRNAGDKFGGALTLSADGRVLAVSEPLYSGSAGDKTGNVRTYLYSPFGYIPMGQDIEGDDATDQFGTSIALSSNGRRLAVGAPYRDNSETKNKEGRLVSGMVRVFDWSVEGKKWMMLGNRTSSTPLIGTDNLDQFGSSIDLNYDGSLLCVGAPRNGGYVQCFEEEGKNKSDGSTFTATHWKQVGGTIRNKEGSARHDDNFGASIRVSRDPTGTRHRVAIGAPGKNDKKTLDAGHVIVYEFNPNSAERGWIQLGKKALTSETPGKDFQMGFSLDFHEDLLAVGIPGANGGNGKVELFKFKKDTWEWIRNPIVFEGVAAESSNYGAAISLTPSGDFAVGGPQSNENVGSVRFYRKKESSLW